MMPPQVKQYCDWLNLTFELNATPLFNYEVKKHYISFFSFVYRVLQMKWVSLKMKWVSSKEETYKAST
jgi:hypothetical protein